MIVALFDSDGTLYTGQFGRGMMKYSSHNNRKHIAWRYYAGVLPAYLLYKAKLTSWEKLQHALLRGLSGLLQGFDKQQADSALTWLLHEYLLPTQREEVFKRLREHQEKGHKVIIVSGMLMPCAEIFRDHIGADGAIGTQPEFKNGRYTGKTILPLISGTTKADKVNELIRSYGWDVDWASSYAYGDSFNDYHMLNLVGNPVAVYPDSKLHALAAEKNWEVLGTVKEA
ncbi:MAG TPA: HAD-IB family hydrolase [Anaerolineales bacterium]|nr:HAD-IB family hydrolase [Anaerolineales bacterium]